MGGVFHRIALLAVPFLTLSSLLAIVASLHPLAIWATVALLIFCLFCVALAKLSGISFIIFSPILALRFTEMLSGASIEAGAFMDGSGAYGYPTGAFSRLLVIYVFTFSFGALVCEILAPYLLQKSNQQSRHDLRWLWLGLLAIVGLSSLYLFYVGVSSGFPLLTNADRFQFLNNQSRIYKSIIQNRLLIVPLLGYLVTNKDFRLRGILLFVWLNLVSVLFAEKFTSLLLMLTLFCMPAGLKAVDTLGTLKIRWIVMAGTAVVIMTVPTVLIVYGALDDLDQAIEKYNRRVAVQGEMWFLTDDPSKYWRDIDWHVVATDAASWIRPGMQDAQAVGRDFGQYYVMAKHAEPDILVAAMDYGGGFIFCLLPYLLMVSGIIGVLLVSLIITAMHAAVIMLLIKSLTSGQWLSALCFTKSFSNILAAYIIGYLWFIFGIKNLFFISAGFGVLIVYLLLANKQLSRIHPATLPNAKRLIH